MTLQPMLIFTKDALKDASMIAKKGDHIYFAECESRSLVYHNNKKIRELYARTRPIKGTLFIINMPIGDLSHFKKERLKNEY